MNPEQDGIVAVEGYYQPERLMARCVFCEDVKEVCCSRESQRHTDGSALVYRPVCPECCDGALHGEE